MSHSRRNDMAGSVASLQIGVPSSAAAKSHRRDESSSTTASSVAEPISYDSAFPSLHIADPDNSPSTLYFEQAGSPTQLFADYYKPSTLSHSATFGLYNQGGAGTFGNDLTQSGIQNMQNTYVTPVATPRSSQTQTNDPQCNSKLFKVPSNEHRPPAPRIELYRTESAAFQDELYNPADFDKANATQQRPQSAMPLQGSNTSQPTFSPSRNLVNEIVKTADSVRSQSPTQPVTGRDNSPYRHGSQLASTDFYQQQRASIPLLNTASAARRQRVVQNAALEVAAHQSSLSRHEPKTISPKDAMLEYNDGDQDNVMSLFQDTIKNNADDLFAAGYLGGMSSYAPVDQASSNRFSFRAADGTTVSVRPPQTSPGASGPTRLPPQQRRSQQYQQHPFRSMEHAVNPEQTPEFPAHLVSMESSISDGTALASSQELNPPSAKRRKLSSEEHAPAVVARSRAAPAAASTSSPVQSGTTIPPSSPDLQSVTSDRPSSEAVDDDATSTSPSDPADPVGHALPASEISARNSQAGPHKCTRINRATGQPCNIIFSRPYDLTRHEDTIHNRVKHKVHCEYCTEVKSFSRSDALTRHMRVVHPEIDHNPKRLSRGF